MTLRLELKSVADVDAIRLLSRIVRTLGTCNEWHHDDEFYTVDFTRDEETKNTWTDNGRQRSRLLQNLAAPENP